MNYVRRFVFVHYRDLLTLRLKKLEKVSDKLFVFTPAAVAQVPLALVRQLQRMGPDLEWIDLGDVAKRDAASIIGFHVGVLHEQVDLGVEFAVLSDDAALDALVAHVEDSGRSCVRVRHQGGDGGEVVDLDAEAGDGESGEGDDDDEVDLDAEAARGGGGLSRTRLPPLRAESLQQRRSGVAGGSGEQARGDLRKRLDTTLPHVGRADAQRDHLNGETRPGGKAGGGGAAGVDALADELVRRLIRSGNRPDDLSMLRSYILLYVEEPGTATHVDDIIAHMAEKGEIDLDGGAVRYNF